MNITLNRADRLLTDARAAHQIVAKYRDLPGISRALSHLEGHLENLNRLRAMVQTKSTVSAR